MKKTVILVDDGIATGSTIRAAVLALRQQEPAKIVIAVPTAAADSCSMLEPLVDELVTLSKPMYFRAVGQWYEDFRQTTDAEVKWLLAQANCRKGAAEVDEPRPAGDGSGFHRIGIFAVFRAIHAFVFLFRAHPSPIVALTRMVIKTVAAADQTIVTPSPAAWMPNWVAADLTVPSPPSEG